MVGGGWTAAGRFSSAGRRISTIAEAVEHSLKDGFTDDSLFIFARALKCFEMTHDHRLPKDELPATFAAWWRAAQPLLPGEASFDEYRLLFLDVFSRVNTPLGSNSLEAATQQAGNAPLPPQAAKYDDPKLRRLVGVMYQLQLLNGGTGFFLAVRDAAKIMGLTNKKLAAKLLHGLVLEGTLVAVEKGIQGGKRATRYRLDLGNVGFSQA